MWILLRKRVKLKAKTMINIFAGKRMEIDYAEELEWKEI